MKFPVALWVSLAASLVVLVLSVLDGDAVTGCPSFALLFVSAVLLAGSRRFEVPDRVPFVAAATCVVCGALLIYMLEWTSGCGMDEAMYSHIEGLVAWGMTFPTAYLAVYAVVNLFGATFNRVVVGGFTAFISIGLMTLTWVYISVFCYGDLDTRYVFSQEVAYLFVNLIVSLVAALVIAKVLKGRHYTMTRREVSE